MEQTILGGSAAGPNPGQGCRGYLTYDPVAPRRLLLLWLPRGGLAILARFAHALADPSQPEGDFSVFETHEYDPDAQLKI